MKGVKYVAGHEPLRSGSYGGYTDSRNLQQEILLGEVIPIKTNLYLWCCYVLFNNALNSEKNIVISWLAKSFIKQHFTSSGTATSPPPSSVSEKQWKQHTIGWKITLRYERKYCFVRWQCSRYISDYWNLLKHITMENERKTYWRWVLVLFVI